VEKGAGQRREKKKDVAGHWKKARATRPSSNLPVKNLGKQTGETGETTWE